MKILVGHRRWCSWRFRGGSSWDFGSNQSGCRGGLMASEVSERCERLTGHVSEVGWDGILTIRKLILRIELSRCWFQKLPPRQCGCSTKVRKRMLLLSHSVLLTVISSCYGLHSTQKLQYAFQSMGRQIPDSRFQRSLFVESRWIALLSHFIACPWRIIRILGDRNLDQSSNSNANNDACHNDQNDGSSIHPWFLGLPGSR